MAAQKKTDDVQDFASFVVSTNLKRFKEILEQPLTTKKGLLQLVTKELVRIDKKQRKNKKK